GAVARRAAGGARPRGPPGRAPRAAGSGRTAAGAGPRPYARRWLRIARRPPARRHRATRRPTSRPARRRPLAAPADTEQATRRRLDRTPRTPPSAWGRSPYIPRPRD